MSLAEQANKSIGREIIPKRCMFCGQHCGLIEETSPYKGVAKILVRCTYCAIDFVATFPEKTWARIKKAYYLAQLGREP